MHTVATAHSLSPGQRLAAFAHLLLGAALVPT